MTDREKVINTLENCVRNGVCITRRIQKNDWERINQVDKRKPRRE